MAGVLKGIAFGTPPWGYMLTWEVEGATTLKLNWYGYPFEVVYGVSQWERTHFLGLVVFTPAGNNPGTAFFSRP